jgi:pimeloyl-ACP methyl ester carboxylesterase
MLAHHDFTLADGRHVGTSVGGVGVPLVFFHGIGMNRRIYLRLLSRLPQLGFTVIAIDAPGHGDTYGPAVGERSFAARIAATHDILDALGIERALLVGHSMGGRTAVELAASRPERALGVVLIDPALGPAFDASRDRLSSPRDLMAGLLSGVFDTAIDRVGLKRLDVVRHFRMFGGRMLNTAVRPGLFLSAAAAIARANDSTIALRLLKEYEVPTAVVHGERDMVVPLDSAIDAALLSGARLVTLPQGYHSWVLPSPWTFVQILENLIGRGDLGATLRDQCAEVRRTGAVATGYTSHLMPGAAIRDLTPSVRVIGYARPRSGSRYHAYRIWD